MGTTISEFLLGAPPEPEAILDYAANGDIDEMEKLIRWYPEQVWEERDEEGKSPLQLAVENDHLEAVKFLILQGCPTRTLDNKGSSPLFSALESGNESIVAILLESGGVNLLYQTDYTKENALTKVSTSQKLNLMKLLLPYADSEHEVNAKNGKGAYPLSICAQNGNLDMLKLLLSNENIKVALANSHGWTPLHYAMERGDPNIVCLLCAAGSPLNVTTSDGRTPLHIGAQKLALECLDIIWAECSPLSEMLVVEGRDIEGNLPLHYLLYNVTKENSEQLLPYIKRLLEIEKKNRVNCVVHTPASLHTRNKKGETPLDIAYPFPLLADFFAPFVDTPIPPPKFSIQIASDLHYEYGHRKEELIIPSARYLALVGDIAVVADKDKFRDILLYMASLFEKVFFVPGNHEFYCSEYEEAMQSMRDICSEHPNILFMDKTSYLVPETNIRILGTILWTRIPKEKSKLIKNCLSDYHKIEIAEEGTVRSLIPEDTNAKFEDQLEWLQTEIAESNKRGEEVVVLTHHSPIYQYGCSNPDNVYGLESEANCAFSTDLRHMMNGNQITLWAYGHTHWFHDMTFDGTRVVSNPHGYPHGDRATYAAEADPENFYDLRFVVSL